MPPRPIYRWKSFWLGVLVLVFLGWGWGRSRERFEIVEWRSTSRKVVATNCYSMVLLTWGDVPSGGREGFRFHHRPINEPPAWFRPEIKFKLSAGASFFSISYWLLILLFLVPWSGWLIWRTRRQRLALRQVIAPPSSQGDAS